MVKTLFTGILFAMSFTWAGKVREPIQNITAQSTQSDAILKTQPVSNLSEFYQLKQMLRENFFQIFNTYAIESAKVSEEMAKTFSGPEAEKAKESCLQQKKAKACILLEALYAESFRQYDLEVFNKFQKSLFQIVDEFNAATQVLEKENHLAAEMAQSSRDFLLFVYASEAKRKSVSFVAMQKASLFKDSSDALRKTSVQTFVMNTMFQGIAEANQEIIKTSQKNAY